MPLQHIEIDYDYDFDVYGLTCQEKDYRLAWALNMALGWNLERLEEHKVQHKKGDTFHIRFGYEDESEGISCALLANKSVGGAMLPEYPSFDYLLLLEGGIEGQRPEIMKQVRAIPFVQAILKLDLQKLKSKNNLITE